ncbi:protein rot1 [Aspergillus desertorum]
MLAVYFVGSLLASFVSARNVADLIGTWTTKSRQVFTVPSRMDVVKDGLIEPRLTGVSFSFTEDGYFEGAFYRAISNPHDQSCPKGIMRWQHGTYTFGSDGSIHLIPIAEDNRQLMSDPCSSSKGLYTRYNQTEKYSSFTLGMIRTMTAAREMLPTGPLKSIAPKKAKRHLEGEQATPFDLRTLVNKDSFVDPDRWLWVGVVMSAIGDVALFFS